MAETVYVLCALTSLFCAVLLWRSYRQSRTKLLMWSTLCFIGLAVNNALLVVDLVLVPHANLALVRSATAMGSMLMLLIGLIWEDQ